MNRPIQNTSLTCSHFFIGPSPQAASTTVTPILMMHLSVELDVIESEASSSFTISFQTLFVEWNHHGAQHRHWFVSSTTTCILYGTTVESRSSPLQAQLAQLLESLPHLGRPRGEPTQWRQKKTKFQAHAFQDSTCWLFDRLTLIHNTRQWRTEVEWLVNVCCALIGWRQAFGQWKSRTQTVSVNDLPVSLVTIHTVAVKNGAFVFN